LVLQIQKVSKKFGNHTAVNQLTLDIPERGMFGFLGGNGAGKTTTFRMILGLLDQTSGDIRWNGKKITQKTSDHIGYLPEERGLYPKLTVKEQLIYLGELKGLRKQTAQQELAAWLERFQINHYLNKRVEELSKGNQQKIQFISAVLHRPKLLILDEPFSGLDPINVEMMQDAVQELAEQGTSIVFSSHQMNVVEELCESLCILRKGEAVVKGNLSDIKHSFGKKNLIIHANEALDFLREDSRILAFKPLANGCRLQIEDESYAQHIMQQLQDRKIFIRKFEIEEPSLNDIFIEKVGETYE